MAETFLPSGKNISLAEAGLQHSDLTEALELFFSDASPSYKSRFFSLQPSDVDKELVKRLRELDLISMLNVLACVEAALRIDYLLRCSRKKHDPVSKKFRRIYRRKRERASLEDDIINTWRDSTDNPKLLSELKGAFKFRHWLAHGRYWEPNLGRQKYDFTYIYNLAISISGLPLQT